MTQPIPSGYNTLSPAIIVKDANAAIEYYKKVFNAKEVHRLAGPDGKIMHCGLQIGNSTLMLCDEMPACNVRGPETLGGSPVGIYVYVENADEVFDRAIKAGGKVEMPLDIQFWGDRAGKFVDPYGHQWHVATHLEDLTPEQISQRAKAAIEKQLAGAKN